MLVRTVNIYGSLYNMHEVVKVVIKINEETQCQVKSTNSSDNSFVTSSHSVSYHENFNLNSLENELWSLPFFDEQIDPDSLLDEVLDILTDEQAIIVPNAFKPWKAGVTYKAGDRVKYLNELYKCLQGHVSQVDWTPDSASSLWSKIISGGGDEILEWVQPDSTNPYKSGDKVSHNGSVWISTIDNNVWEPGVYGWEIFS